jgi:hypothetical protein
MAYTAALGQLIQQLHTDQQLQSEFEQSPQLVCEKWDLTTHEHDAMVDRDCDELVALGVADSVGDLPEVLGCGGDRGPGPRPGGSLAGRLKDVIQRLRKVRPKVFDRGPGPPPQGS